MKQKVRDLYQRGIAEANPVSPGTWDLQMYLPGGALSGKRENPFDSKSWAGMSGSVLRNYINAQNKDLASMITAHVFESGSFMGNLGATSSSDGGSAAPQNSTPDQGTNIYYDGKSEHSISKQGSAAWCVVTVLEQISLSVEGDNKHSAESLLEYSAMNIRFTIPIDGFSQGEIPKIIAPFFQTKGYNSLYDAIDAGYPVFLSTELSNGQGHALMGIGYNTLSRQIIYLDPGIGGGPQWIDWNIIQPSAYTIIKNK